MSSGVPKVAVLADWWWPETVGGAERSARSAAMELARFAEVAVFVPTTSERVYQDGPLTVHAVRRPFARRRHADSVPRRGLEFLAAWLYPPVAWRLAAALRRFGPDVTVATNVSRTGPWLLRQARLLRRAGSGGTRLVRIYHDLSDTCWRRSRLKAGAPCGPVCRECRVKTRIMRWATPPDALSVCVSNFVRDELAEAGLTTPATSAVAYPAIGPEAGGRGPAAGGLAPGRPAASGRAASEPVLGYIGRIDPVKGVELAIRTAGGYRRATGRQVSMVVAGTGRSEYLRHLAGLAAREAVNVEFAGELDIEAFCARVDVVLIPSIWLEPFGRVAVEVGSRGLPMLVSPVGGLPEAVAVSGGRAAFADFTRPEDAARRLGDLLAGSVVPNAPVPNASVPNASVPNAPVPLPRGVAQAVQAVLGALTEGRR